MKFEIGDTVYLDSGFGYTAKGKVERILKNSIEMGDGSRKFKADFNGFTLPRQKYSSSRWVKETPEIKAEIEKEMLLMNIKQYKFDNLDLPTLVEVWGILKGANK